jgi:hypothetical protein
VALTVAFALVAVHRAVRRDLPGTLMAAGMAAMSPGMAGLGPDVVHGWWWAAAFAVVAVWPVVGRVVRGGRAGEVCGGPLGHLLGGVAMIYLCALHGLPGPAGPSSAGASTRLTAHGTSLVPLGHHHGTSGTSGVTLPGTIGPSGWVGVALAVLGWGLVCYFLLRTVIAMTRRDAEGTSTASRPTALGEAWMAVGTVIMLVAMT